MEIDTTAAVQFKAQFTKAKCSSKKSLLSILPDESQESFVKRQSDLDVCLKFFDSYQQLVELEAIEAFCKDFNEKVTGENNCSLINTIIPSFIFTSSISSYSSLKEILSVSDKKETGRRQVGLIDCSVIDSKVDFFNEMITGIIGVDNTSSSDDNGSLSYDFANLTNNSNLNANKKVTILFKNSAKLNLSHLNDFIKLWDRKEAASLPRLSLIFDDVCVFIGMDRNLRESFKIYKHRSTNQSTIFNDLLVKMTCDDVPLYLSSALISQLSAITSLSPLMARLKFLSIANFSTLKGSEDATKFNPEMKNLLLFLNRLTGEIHKIRPSAPTWNYSHIYGSILSLSGKEFECLDQIFREIIGELKSIPPNDLIFILLNAKKCLNEKDQLFQFIQTKIIDVMKSATEGTNCKDNKKNNNNNNNNKASSSNLLKDTQLNVINDLSNYLHSLHANLRNNVNNYTCVFEDSRGILRKAFEADPTAALQTALKHPNFYLNRPEVLVSKNRKAVVSSENLSTALITENSSKLFDTCLLYRLSLEINHKTINLVEWYNSFTSVLGAKPNQTDSKALMARFFKSLNELQLIGMVSEFGKSRRKRRTVDRLNLTDNLEFY